MARTETCVVVATRSQPCEVCRIDVQPGERIVYRPGPPRGVLHPLCDLRARRGSR